MSESIMLKVFGIEVLSSLHCGQVSALADGASEAILSAFDSILGPAPTFEAWEAARMAWREGYAQQREGVSAGALDKAWSRFAAGLSTEKPKSTKAASERAAKARINPFEGKPREEVMSRVEELREVLATPGAIPSAEVSKEWKQATDALAKADKAEAKAKAEAEAEATKARRDTLRGVIKECTPDVLVTFEALADALNENLPGPARINAWELIYTIMPATVKARALEEKHSKRRAA